MTVSAGLLLVALVTCAICFAGIVVIGRARRAARVSDAGEGFASRADTQRLLAENWAQVEQTARSSGMSDEEIKRVRANILGLHDH
ncbi:MAG TPA: hypothetical protein VE757_09310 [Gaiellaceae bacterium]|nr:hypothetical protein [Gaiellaceae bacterium]